MFSRTENTALTLNRLTNRWTLTPHKPKTSRPRRAAAASPTPTATGRWPATRSSAGIGRGGFGEVYFAVSDGGKEVALKLIRHNLDVELRGVTHCLNLKHPNLIALYDVKQDEQDNSWVVMEYATGESLEDVIRRNPNGLLAEEAVDWMQGIAAGVAYLHDHGIVHRDLKPGNIFRDDGQVKLGDYGLSKFISCSRRSGQTESIGTVHYMAPEVANGRYGKEIDIYALGIILYEMLTGHVPFEGESVGEVLMKHLTAEPSLAEVPERLSRSDRPRAGQGSRSRRFASVGEMMHSLPPLAATMAYRAPIRHARDRSPPTRPAAATGAAATVPPQSAAPAAATVGPAVAAAAGRRRGAGARRLGRRRADLAGDSRRLAGHARFVGQLQHAHQGRAGRVGHHGHGQRQHLELCAAIWPAAGLPCTCSIASAVRWCCTTRPSGCAGGQAAAAADTRPIAPARRPPVAASAAAAGARPAAPRCRPRPIGRRAIRARRLAQGFAASLEAPLAATLAAAAAAAALAGQVTARARGRSGRLDDAGRRDRRADEPRGGAVAGRRDRQGTICLADHHQRARLVGRADSRQVLGRHRRRRRRCAA